MRSVQAVVCVKEYVIAEISILVLMESHSGEDSVYNAWLVFIIVRLKQFNMGKGRYTKEDIQILTYLLRIFLRKINDGYLKNNYNYSFS